MFAQVDLSDCLNRAAQPKEGLTLLKFALATARELDGCDGEAALKTSVLLGSTHVLMGLHREGAALLMDTHKRCVSVGGIMCLPAIMAASYLFRCMPFLPACHYRAATSKARSVLLALGVTIPPSASALDIVNLAFKVLELREENA